MKTMAAAKFKAQCLAVMDEIQLKRESVLVTKHGRPVAKMVPLDIADEVDPLDAFRYPGKITIHGDIMSPAYTDIEYERFYQELIERNR